MTVPLRDPAGVLTHARDHDTTSAFNPHDPVHSILAIQLRATVSRVFDGGNGNLGVAPSAYGFVEWSYRTASDTRLEGQRIFSGLVVRY